MSKVAVLQDRVYFPWRDDVKAILPETDECMHKAKRLGVLDHGIVETKLLRNLGMEVPAPILTRYGWADSTPFDSQKQTAALLSTEPRAYCLSSMGVGKTRAALYAYDFMREQGIAKKMLVVAPLSTLVDVWEREVFENFHHLTAVTLHGTKAQRLKNLAVEHNIYIINHDGVGTILKELIEEQFDVVAIDELASYRNSQTRRWKVMDALINRQTHHPVAWGLTGSPTPNAPTDAYGQVKLLTPDRVPRSFRQFQQMTMVQISQFKWHARRDSNEIVAKAMKPSVRFKLDECHDIPATTYSMRHIDPTSEQAALYRALVDQLYLQYKGQEITAVNEGAKLSKLLQISAGFAYSDDKGVYINAKSRIKEVINLIEQADKKVLIFANFKWMIRALAEVIGNYYTVAVIHGDVPKKERDKIFAGFRRSNDPQVIVAHAGTMAHGLTLVEADTIIWYGPTLNSELYEQANARIRRPGQTSHTHVIHIESTPAEKKMFRRLQNKQKSQGLLLELFSETDYES